ncbi:MAG: hypothetical protein FWD49_02900 [Firmicutes bacterium]|nr:hypothetical protein [Bacillota bacterium]
MEELNGAPHTEELTTAPLTDFEIKVKRFFGSKLGFAMYIALALLFVLTLIFVCVQGTAGRLTARQTNGGITSLIIMLAVMHLSMFFRVKLKFHMPVYIDIYAVFAIFGHMAGLLLGWYEGGWHADTILHGLAGVLFTFIGFSFVPLFAGRKDIISSKHIPKAMCVMVAVGFSACIAMFWEIFEFTLDTIDPRLNAQAYLEKASDPETLYRGSGLIDTMLDLTSHAIGTVISAIAGYIIMKKKPNDLRWLIYKI